jgi:hypothetical protein
MLKDIFSLLEAQDLVWLTGVIVAAVTTAIQGLSKKYKPWSWLARKFGSAMNKDMLDKLDTLSTKVDQLEKRDDEQDAAMAEEHARAARRRILRCSDEIRRKERHSEEYFNDVLDDISYYKKYCDEHPKFENEKAVLAIRLVEKTYEKCVSDNDFL